MAGIARSHWRTTVWGAAALLLLLPALAMQVTDEVAWGPTDFALLASMLAASLGAYESAARKASNGAYRAAVVAALATAFLLIWVTLAVGIIGAEGNPANLMYGGVLAVGIISAAAARVRPYGMARAMTATALAQALVAVVALLTGSGTEGSNWPWDVLVLTGFFAALWLLSAWLFRSAARAQTRMGSAIST